MPGSGQWYESSNINIPSSLHYKHQCWLCEGHVFSIIFWSRKNGFRLGPLFTSNSGKGKEAELIKNEIDKYSGGMVESVKKTVTVDEEGNEKVEVTRVKEAGLGHVNGAVPYECLDDGVPYLAGSFTGWRYKKMERVFDICKTMNPDYVDAFIRCKESGRIRKKVQNLE